MLVRALGSAIAVSAALSGAPAEAGFIGDACIRANRPAATRELCTCIDRVAKKSLSIADQRRGASFFKKPHDAQRVRQSTGKSDAAFWENWKAFGEQAAKTCG